MSASLIIVVVVGSLFIGALLYLGAGKTVKKRPKKIENFSPFVIIFMPLFSWMAYTQINSDQSSLFTKFPALNYLALGLFVGGCIIENRRTKG